MGTRIGWSRSQQRLISTACLLAALVTGCIRIGLDAPVPVKDFANRRADVVVLQVQPTSKRYEWKGSWNLTPVYVRFGAALEARAKQAFEKGFARVVVADNPTHNGSSSAPFVSLTLRDASMVFGATTLSSAEAELTLQMTLRRGDRQEEFSTTGRGHGSPIAVLAALPAFSQSAYQGAMRDAAELALKDALEQAVAETLTRLQND